MADITEERKDDEQPSLPVNAAVNYPKNVDELTQYIQFLLQQVQEKFQDMSDQILSRIDEMGNRIDDLEKNISELMTQAGVELPDK